VIVASESGTEEIQNICSVVDRSLAQFDSVPDKIKVHEVRAGRQHPSFLPPQCSLAVGVRAYQEP
jgi:hypothetical protein